MIITLDNVLTASEVVSIRAQLAGAPWREGIESAGSLGREIKRNQQADEQAEAIQSLRRFVSSKVTQHPEFVSCALPKALYPPRFNRYMPGDGYGMHVDSAVMRDPRTQQILRTDLSVTLFLSAPEEYDGGVLEIESQFGVQEVKLAPGSLVLYPASSLHRVTPVRRGERLAAFFWVQSLIRDASVRAALFDLDRAIQSLTAESVTAPDTLLQLSGVYHNLIRIHAES